MSEQERIADLQRRMKRLETVLLGGVALITGEAVREAKSAEEVGVLEQQVGLLLQQISREL